MRLNYDPEGDVLEVIFSEALHRGEKKAYKLREGMILYVSPGKMLPVQLTLVNYRKAAQLPAIYFEGWLKLNKDEQKKVLPIITSPPVSAFLRFDPQSGYGHLSTPGVMEVVSAEV
ncbi:MAG: hypothetical protein CV087_11240 [Candidatus Brocadia sp. WS118]|nr:MAG: hypothetical protein CV087_11240 [Candidatus Brocadia sp. WS118]